MNSLLQFGAASAGVFLIGSFARSISHAAVVNRRTGDAVARTIGRVVHRTLSLWARRLKNYSDVQDVMAWALPTYVISLIIVWFGLVQVGFSLLIWSFQVEHDPVAALIASGSALSTLGFLTPPGVAGQSFAIVEGAVGLGIIVFYFTFIPGFQTSIQARQTRVAWLYARSGPALSNFALINWFQICGATDWNGLWEGWELWFRNIAETHTLTPILAMVPTVHRGQTWLRASAVALDSVLLYIVALESEGVPAARVCFEAGVGALRSVAAEFPAHKGTQAFPAGAIIARVNFDNAFEHLKTKGPIVSIDRELCWLRFSQLRKEYEEFLTSLAESLLVPVQDSLLFPLAESASRRARSSLAGVVGNDGAEHENELDEERSSYGMEE